MKFSIRAFISILLTFCFIGLALSGICLYIAPQCSVAGQIGWSKLGLSKDQWSIIHMVTALTFILLVAAHLLLLNGKVFLAYLQKNSTRASRFPVRAELAVAIVISAILIGGAALQLRPFKWLPEKHDQIQAGHREDAGIGKGPGQGWRQQERGMRRQ